MQLAQWPTRLKHESQKSSYNLTPFEQQIRSDFEYGPARMRQRFTRQISMLDHSLYLEGDEVEVFKGFFKHTLAGGVKWFKVKLWSGSEYIEHVARFTEPYKVGDVGFNHMVVSMKWEIRDLFTWDEATTWLVGEYGSEFVTGTFTDPLQEAVNVTYPNITKDYGFFAF